MKRTSGPETETGRGDGKDGIKVNSRNRLYWSFFLDEDGKIRYNSLCERCANDCKQSFRTVIVNCHFFKRKEVKEK